MQRNPLYKQLAQSIDAYLRCQVTGNTEWRNKHYEDITYLTRNFMPSGSGIDNGTAIELSDCTPDKIAFSAGYHHMDENGYYNGWTEHTITVRPSLAFGIDIRISGPNRNDIKDYLAETYGYALKQEVWQDSECNWHSAQFEPAQ